jgi:hypothetical protein
MVTKLGDMTNRTFLITKIVVWAVSKFSHILTHLEGQSSRPVQQSAAECNRVHEAADTQKGNSIHVTFVISVTAAIVIAPRESKNPATPLFMFIL